MVVHRSLFASFFELGFDARGFAESNAVEFFGVERRLARLQIPGVQQTEDKLVVARVAEEVTGNPGGGVVAVFRDRLARELRPEVRWKRLGSWAPLSGLVAAPRAVSRAISHSGAGASGTSAG